MWVALLVLQKVYEVSKTFGKIQSFIKLIDVSKRYKNLLKNLTECFKILRLVYSSEISRIFHKLQIKSQILQEF